MSDMDKERRIRDIAYQLWEDEGRPAGKAEEHWRRARELVENETADESPSLAQPPARKGRQPKSSKSQA